MDSVYLFSRLELTINWIAFSIELIYCTDKGAAYGKKLLKTVLISVRCRTRSLPFKLFKSLLKKNQKKLALQWTTVQPTRSPVHWPLDWTKMTLWISWPRMLKVAPCTVARSYIQIFSAWWVTTILYSYGATLCELRYNAVGVLIGQWPILNKNCPY